MSLGARRRYIAVAAGTYPPPARPRPFRSSAGAAVSAGRADFGGEPEPTLEGPAFDAGDDLDLGGPVPSLADPFARADSLAGAGPAGPDVAAPAAGPAAARSAVAAPPPGEPDLDALLSGPVSPTFASLGSDYAAAADPAPSEDAASYGDAEVRRSSRLGGVPPGRMLLGAAAGALLGLLASFALLTLLPDRPGGFDSNPVTLWQNAEPRMQLMVWLVTGGFALLGAAFGARSGPSRR